MDDVAVGSEQAVCFNFLEGERDGFLTERTPYLFERKQLICALILDEIDIGEAALEAQNPLDMLANWGLMSRIEVVPLRADAAA